MTRIYAKHPPYNDGHLGRVSHDMDVAGAPTIRAVEYKGELFALEGSHRLALTHELGIPPKVIILEADTSGTDEFFERIKSSLPAYDFDYILKLKEEDFK